MADTPLGGSQGSETASEPGIKSPEHSMSPESVTDTTPTTLPKSQPPKRRGKGGVWKSGNPESGIGTGIGTGTGTGTGIGTGMGRETYIKAGTTFTLI